MIYKPPGKKCSDLPTAISAVTANANFPLTNNVKPPYSTFAYQSCSRSQRAQLPQGRKRQNPSNNRPAGRVKTDAQEDAPLPTEGQTERDAAFSIFASYVGSEKRKKKPESPSSHPERVSTVLYVTSWLALRYTWWMC